MGTDFHEYDDLFFQHNFVKIPNSFVDVLLPCLAPEPFRLIMYVWRNTYGRRDMRCTSVFSGKRRSRYWSNFEAISAKRMGQLFGFRSLDPSSRGLSRWAVRRYFDALHEAGLVTITNPGHDRGQVRSPNHYGLGQEIFQLLGTGDLGWQLRAQLNTEVKKGKPTYAPKFLRPDYVDVHEWSGWNDGRGPKNITELRRVGVEAVGSLRQYLIVEPEEIRGSGLALLPRDKNGVPSADICERRWFQMPTAFEDVIAPNVPIKLYPFLVFVLRETFGRAQFKVKRFGPVMELLSDFEKTRHFVSYTYVAGLLGVSVSTAKRLVGWAKDNGILDAATRKEWRVTNGTNGYLLGPEVLHVFQTGDFTREYRERNKVLTKPGKPAFGLREWESWDDATTA